MIFKTAIFRMPYQTTVLKMLFPLGTFIAYRSHRVSVCILKIFTTVCTITGRYFPWGMRPNKIQH